MRRVPPRPAWRLHGREYHAGDRIVARRNERDNDIDNGSLATVITVDERDSSLIVQTDSGDLRALDHDYVAGHVEHAYALTAHAAQAATVDWAAVVGRPGDFTREWAYTALSRARGATRIYLIAEPAESHLEREEYAPTAPVLGATQALRSLSAAMSRSGAEPLAIGLAGLAHLRRRQATRGVPSLRL